MLELWTWLPRILLHHGENHIGESYLHCHHTQPGGLHRGRPVKNKQNIDASPLTLVTPASTTNTDGIHDRAGEALGLAKEEQFTSLQLGQRQMRGPELWSENPGNWPPELRIEIGQRHEREGIGGAGCQ